MCGGGEMCVCVKGYGGLQGDRECDITSHLVRGSCLDWPKTPPVSPAMAAS